MALPIDSARANFRLLTNQHALLPFTYSCILHFPDEGNDSTLFEKMRDHLPSDFAFVAFRELSKRGKRPHYHLLLRTSMTKEDVQRWFVLMTTDGRNGKKRRFALRWFRPVSESDTAALFRYWTKATPRLQSKNQKLAGRNMIPIGPIWTKKTSQLRKMTPEQIERRVVDVLMADRIAVEYLVCEVDERTLKVSTPNGIDWERARTDAGFFSWYVRAFVKKKDYLIRANELHDEWIDRAKPALRWERPDEWLDELYSSLEHKAAGVLY